MINAEEMRMITEEGRRRNAKKLDKEVKKALKRMAKEALKGNDYCFFKPEAIENGVGEVLRDAGYTVERYLPTVRRVSWSR